MDRALALTMPRIIRGTDVGGAGGVGGDAGVVRWSRRLGWQLVPPAGQPAVFGVERQRMAGFPPQPDRFVGRVGALARSATVLAPNSGWSGAGVPWDGGAGKTTCALELAYTHQESFPEGLVWWAAPAEGRT